MRSWKSPRWFLLMGATFLLFGINLYFTINQQHDRSNDFSGYTIFIDHLKNDGTITTPHFVYPLLVAAASAIFPNISYLVLGACVVLLFQLLLANVFWIFWKQVLPKPSSELVIVALTLAMMTIAPVNLLTLLKQNGYAGYIGITVYHNPPISLCRPMALLNFMLFAVGAVNRKFSARQISLCFATMALATLMKPNYALIMVPAAAIFAIVAIVKKDFKLLRFISISTLLPGLLILAGQFIFTYISPNAEMGQSHILFAPFIVYTNGSRYIFPKFFLSVLFPLCVLVAFGKQAMQDRYFTIGLLLFFFGAFQSYFLAESGQRMNFGNFFWSGQLGLFLWFVASARFVVKRVLADPSNARWSPKSIVIYLAFSLHVVSGIIWYALETSAAGVYW